MNLSEIETTLAIAGFQEDFSRRKRVNNCCTNIYFQDGGVLCVYDTGTVTLQGNATQVVCEWYEHEVKPKNTKSKVKHLASEAEDFCDAIPPDYENDDARCLTAPDMWSEMESQSLDELPPQVVRTSTEIAIGSVSRMQMHPEEKQPLPFLPNNDEW
ncbi:MAG: hypothetical protein KGM99_16175 [Burkholderiales bacterium]|nr:hypothetical protein [Burkholderiales bacterium]